MATIVRVEISKTHIVLVRRKTYASIKATVITSDNSRDKNIGFPSENREIARATYALSASNSNSKYVNVEGFAVGSTTMRFYSKTDPTKYAILYINVVETQEEADNFNWDSWTPGGTSGEGGGSSGGGSGSGGSTQGGTAFDPSVITESGNVFSELGEDEEITDITSVGNTLIITTPLNMYYFLWKEAEYHFLGNSIPSPEIHFRIGNLDAPRVSAAAPEITASTNEYDLEGELFYKDDEYAPQLLPEAEIGDTVTYGAKSKKYIFDYTDDDGLWNEYLDDLWGFVDSKVNEQTSSGKAVFPVFVRYAIRLYDGTLCSQSIPVLLGADVEKPMDISVHVAQTYNESSGIYTLSATKFKSFVSLANGYSIVMSPANANLFSGWEDIVKGVDIFVSPQMKPTQRNAAKIQLKYLWVGTAYNHHAKKYGGVVVLDPYYTEDNQEELVLLNQSTYLAKSYTTDEFNALSGEILLDDINFSSDYILAQEPLVEVPQSMHHYKAERLFNYNKRLMLGGASQELYHGYPFIHSAKWNQTPASGSPGRFVFVYYIRGENGENIVASRNVEGTGMIITPKSAAIVKESATMYSESPIAWFAYPDSRCYKMEVCWYSSYGAIDVATFTMKPFSQADVAYAFFGFGKLAPFILKEQPYTFTVKEDAVYNMPNTLVVSKANNPFVFPATDMVTFTAGEIMSIAVATKALSEGQFGQFPLYVFTDEGVYALSVASDGSFTTSHPVSRDVLIGRNAVAGIEQGVFFAASRGLLLLQGSQVTKVSALMDGYPESLDDARIAEPLLNGIPLDEPDRFIEFIKDCAIAYDYANTRIVLFNKNVGTQYVYKFDTQTWHRMNAGIGSFSRILNSYPEADVVMKNANGTSTAYNISITGQSDGAKALPGFVYTREMALDGADIYKTISRLKVRGRFKDGHVKWQLQGSNDGIDYHTIHSLRGPSWKWYRIVLVTLLDKDERISYIELDYTPRFTDKIR